MATEDRRADPEGEMLYVYYGEDDFSRREAVQRLSESLGDPESAALNTTFIGADDARPAEVIARASAVPFLGPRRLVVVNGVLSKFELADSSGTGSRRRQPTASSRGSRNAKSRQDAPGGVGGWDNVVEAAGSLPDSNVLVFGDGELSASNPLLALLAPVAHVRQFTPLDAAGTVRWIHERARELGSRIEQDAAAELAEAAPGELWTLDAELTKLALYAGEAPITSHDLAELGSLPRRETIFAVVDAIVAGQHGEARIHLDNVFHEPGMTTSKLVDSLSRQFRNLIVAKDLMDLGASRDDVRAGIGTRSDFAVQKVMSQARRFTMDQLIAMHGYFLAFDLGIKTGRFDEKIGLELLLVQLCAETTRRRVA